MEWKISGWFRSFTDFSGHPDFSICTFYMKVDGHVIAIRRIFPSLR